MTPPHGELNPWLPSSASSEGAAPARAHNRTAWPPNYGASAARRHGVGISVDRVPRAMAEIRDISRAVLGAPITFFRVV